jgi:hypothetical protein
MAAPERAQRAAGDTGLQSSLLTLATVQLQVQASWSATLDARAIGVIAIDAAMAAIAVSVRLAHAQRVVTLTLLAASACLAARAIFVEGARRLGPRIARMLSSRCIYDDSVLQEAILSDLARDVKANELDLTRKAPRLAGAFAFLAFSALVLIASLY